MILDQSFPATICASVTATGFAGSLSNPYTALHFLLAHERYVNLAEYLSSADWSHMNKDATGLNEFGAGRLTPNSARISKQAEEE